MTTEDDGTSGEPAPRSLKPTPRYERVVAAAHHVALAEGADFVGVEHLMLAIPDDGASVATAALERLVALDAVRAELRSILDSEGYRAAL